MIAHRATVVVAASILLSSGCSPSADSTPETPFVQAASAEDAGRYLAYLGGCHDCHTAGWIETGGQVPEAERLAGNRVGWRGPWGTTYPPNLRLTVQSMTEDAWVEMFRTRTERPPMPWVNFRHKSDRDLLALYRYIKSLGPAGEPAPPYLPPDQAPNPPYFDLVVPAGI